MSESTTASKIQMEFELGGDGESEKMFVSRDEYARIFGEDALKEELEMNPGHLRCGEGGYLNWDHENIPVSLTQLARALGGTRLKMTLELPGQVRAIPMIRPDKPYR